MNPAAALSLAGQAPALKSVAYRLGVGPESPGSPSETSKGARP
jgi:hypothetical protein